MKKVLLILLVNGLVPGLLGCRSVSPPASPSPDLRSLSELSGPEQRLWLKGSREDWRSHTDQARGLPAPAKTASFPPDAPFTDLAEPDLKLLGQRSLADVMVHRRSRRDYNPQALALNELGFLLWSAQGISGADFNDDGSVQRTYRTAPSAGGLFPLNTYVVVQRVKGLKPGLYGYRSAEHQLFLLQEAELIPELQEACYGAAAIAQSAVVVIWTAVPYRTEWKYGPMAHRMIAMEAGHACQNLYLSAESLGAGACAMQAYDQQLLDRLLGVDGDDEFAVYMASVGKVD